MIHAHEALQISAILGNCICEGNSMTVLQLQLDMHAYCKFEYGYGNLEVAFGRSMSSRSDNIC